MYHHGHGHLCLTQVFEKCIVGCRSSVPACTAVRVGCGTVAVGVFAGLVSMWCRRRCACDFGLCTYLRASSTIVKWQVRGIVRRLARPRARPRPERAEARAARGRDREAVVRGDPVPLSYSYG
eukprot:6816146-Prymnesium_polylepis.2